MSNYSMSGRTLSGLTQSSYGNKRRLSMTDIGMAMNNGLRYGQGMSATRTMTKQRNVRRGYRKSFAQKVRSIQPAKHWTSNSAVTINNATIYTWNITAGVIQGDTNAQREGDSIYMEALKLEGFMQTATASNAYKFRVLVGYSGEEYSVTTLTASLLADAELFLPNTTATVVNGIINPKTFTVIYDEVIDLNSQIEGDRTIQSTRTTIKLNKRFNYQNSGSAFGKNQNLYVVVISYSADTAVGDSNGSAVLSADLIFRD